MEKKPRYLGSFMTLEEAAEARQKGEELFDEFLTRYYIEHPDQKPGSITQEEIREETAHIVHTLHAESTNRKVPV